MEKSKLIDKLIDINLEKIYNSKGQSLTCNELVGENGKYLDYSKCKTIWREMQIEDLVEPRGFKRQIFDITKKGMKIYEGSLRNKPSYNNDNMSEKATYNDFSGATIGMLNQDSDLENNEIKITQQNHPAANENIFKAIISFISKVWWKVLIPLAVATVAFLINEKIIDISWMY